MTMFTRQREVFSQGASDGITQETITLGTVVDTNDPQQMGRVRAVCPQWGDRLDQSVEDVPWAIYCTPFGGQVSVGSRGPGIQDSEGGIAYGMWAIPKVGAQVLVMCVDSDPRHRIYIGCVYDQLTPHTLPHGRFMYDDHPELEKRGANMRPFGPFTSREKSINPLFDNLKEAFGNKQEPNYEWRSRAADHTAAALAVEHLDHTYSRAADDKDFSYDDWHSNQGYQSSRIDPHAQSSQSKNYDSMVYSITSPGFHALSMDDRQENCRMRLRTSSGHQIIMDDTNERIYIATAKGNNWIEMDQDGNIDMFTTNKVNVRAQSDINFTSDETIRFHAGKGIHMYSGGEVRVEAQSDIHIKAATAIRAHAGSNLYLQSDAATHMVQGSSMYLTAGADFNAKSGSDMKLTSGGSMNVLASGSIIQSGQQIHFNGPSAANAADGSPAGESPAMWTNRVPTHEPFARTMTSTDFSHSPEFKYTDPRVNREERGRTIVRGMYWRR